VVIVEALLPKIATVKIGHIIEKKVKNYTNTQHHSPFTPRDDVM
jgi:hypothetical protein